MTAPSTDRTGSAWATSAELALVFVGLSWSTGAVTVLPSEDDHLVSLISGWSEQGSGSLARRLAQALRRVIAAGLVPAGTRLPPERRLARALAVSRGTVTTALDELRAEGRLASRTGSGTEVVGGPTGPGTVLPNRMSGHFLGAPALVNLSAGNPPDASHLPALTLTTADLAAEGEGHGLVPQGLASLRSALAAGISAEGMVIHPDHIHVTSGSHHALALVTETTVAPGDAVIIEDPSYPGAFDVVDYVGGRTIALARDHTGPDPALLDRLLREHRPSLIYLQGGAHNPLGSAPSPARWRGIAEVLDAHRATVVEDRALTALTPPEERPPPLATLCRAASVVTLGSIGKVTWAGLRIGWLHGPPPIVERTVRRRTVTDVGTSIPAQLFAVRLLPELDRMAAQRRDELRIKAALAIARLADEVPEWEIDQPRGGSVLWPRMPVADSGPVVQQARREGVLVAPGSIARAGRVPDPHMRLCVDRSDAVIDEGLTRLVRGWHVFRDAHPAVLG